MKKNTAGQTIGAEMVNATTGAAFTGAVTVYVTGDGGTQAIGSVASGACTHEGNGYHSYAPAQAETNYDHVAWTFIGTGAIPATIQVYPAFPQTGDSFARLGAPAGASVSADIAAVKSDTASALTRLPAALIGGRMDSSVGAMTSAAVQAIWDALTSALTTVGSIGKLLVDNINATVGSRATPAEVNAEVVDALNVDTYAEPGQGAPPATTSLANKIGYQYKAWRNKKTQTSTTFSLFADDATTVDQKSTVSDDGTTATVGEIATGP